MKTSFSRKYFVIYLILISGFVGCTQINVYEQNSSIKNYKWADQFKVPGTFNITDTTSAYNISVVIRHTDAYNYNNIWLNIGLKAPGEDSLRFQKINLQLGNDVKGWEGVGMNDIWEVRKVISGTPKRFKTSGTYSFQIQHIMRDNPLDQIVSVGLRVEKAL